MIPTDELIFFRGVGQPPTSIDNTRCFSAIFRGVLVEPSDGRIRSEMDCESIYVYANKCMIMQDTVQRLAHIPQISINE